MVNSSTFVIVRPLGKGAACSAFELPKPAYVGVGDYVVYLNREGQERIGIAVTPDIRMDKREAREAWGETGRIAALLGRIEMEWPDEMEDLPEIE